ncbi:MAG: SDR family oxidoreductase [Actinomycetota bacterium]|nr:SDR family oxidoreductase [Actinomycetota bacterium]
MRIAVTGATGYIGGRLVPRLLAEGHDVVCLARSPAKLADRPWSDKVEVIKADLIGSADLDTALAGCDIAYYLVHSMGSGSDFDATDRRGAERFIDAAEKAGVKRVVYLGGLGSEDDALSDHLSSRHNVGVVLASRSVPVTEFRAAVVIGSGSVSFEMLRHLTQVLPIMTTPKWVRTRCQPIAIRDVLSFLVAGIAETSSGHRVYEIGGPDVLTYEEMMQGYASVVGLSSRLIIPVPVLSPRLSSLWVGLVTPLPINVARPLVESLRNEVVVKDDSAKVFAIPLLPFEESVRLAVTVADDPRSPTRWTDAEYSPASPMPTDPNWSGGTVYEDVRVLETNASVDHLYATFSRVGGEVGYYGFRWAWRIRGLIDTVVGGVGLRRGRRHPTDLRLGDVVDFWRVSHVIPGHRLELVSEMKMPGDAWLVWEARPTAGGSTLVQSAFFLPRGLLGRLYWFLLMPLHGPIFGRMLRSIASEATSRNDLDRTTEGQV